MHAEKQKAVREHVRQKLVFPTATLRLPSEDSDIRKFKPLGSGFLYRRQPHDCRRGLLRSFYSVIRTFSRVKPEGVRGFFIRFSGSVSLVQNDIRGGVSYNQLPQGSGFLGWEDY